MAGQRSRIVIYAGVAMAVIWVLVGYYVHQLVARKYELELEVAALRSARNKDVQVLNRTIAEKERIMKALSEEEAHKHKLSEDLSSMKEQLAGEIQDLRTEVAERLRLDRQEQEQVRARGQQKEREARISQAPLPRFQFADPTPQLDASRAVATPRDPNMPRNFYFFNRVNQGRAVSNNIHIARATANPYLADKLEKWLDMVAAVKAGKQEGRYVSCHPANQMGNRVRFVIPCLLFAILTNRALQVNFGSGFQASMTDLFEVPYDVEGDPGAGGNLYAGGQKRFDWPGDIDQLTCTDVRLMKEKTVTFGGCYYFVPHLYHNPYLREEISLMFPDGKIAEPLMLFMMYPRKEVLDIVYDVQKKWGLLDASFVIGVQLRYYDTNKWISPKEFELFEQCAHELTPPHLRHNAKWFIAADCPAGIAAAMKHLNASHLVSRWKPDEFVFSSGPAQLREAVADIILLALSDELVINPWSSYGQYAATYHRKPAYWWSDFGSPPGHDYGIWKEVSKGCFRLTTNEFSVGEWSEWGPQYFSCYHGSMADHWAVPLEWAKQPT